jgi:ankyrin repeat protein
MSRNVCRVAILCAVFAASAVAAPPETTAPKRTVSKVQSDLFEAAKSGHAKDVQRALAAGAKIDGLDQQGVTAITYAVVYNSFNGREVIRDLLKSKASVKMKSDDGRTPLMFAAQYEKSEHFADLLGAGADINAKDNDDWTPLMYAALYGRSNDVDALLKAGADLRAQATDGKTAVLLAVQHGSEMSIKALLAAGGTLDGKSLKHTTPLILAAVGDDLSTVELVLKSKPDLNRTNADGDTALMIAAYRGNPDTVMALLRAGADIKGKDKDGQTAVDLAKQSKCEECAVLLGDKWEKRKPSGGSTLSVPCDPLGGAMDVNITTEEGNIVWSVFYPKVVGAYLGGFNLGDKKIPAGVDIYLDVDNNPKTGLKPASGVSGDLGTGGAEYVISLSEMGTSVRNEETGKYHSRQVLDPSISKGEEHLGPDQMGDWIPKVERDLNAVRLRVPMSVFGLKPGAKIRVTARPGFCAPKSKVVTVG